MSDAEKECLWFADHLDAYIDGTLSEAEIEKMTEHAEHCAPCGDEFKRARQLAGLFSGLEKNVTVPLSTQAAWRSAIREEIRTERRDNKKAKGRGWIRALSAVAAALVVWVGCTASLRANGYFSSAAGNDAADKTAVHHVFIDTAGETLAQGAAMARSVGGDAVLISDGDAAGDANGQAAMLSVTTAPDAAAMENTTAYPSAEANALPMLAESASCRINVEDMKSRSQMIEELTAEYEGYVASFTTGATVGETLYSLRVPRSKFGEFLTALEQVGMMSNLQRQAENVAAGYYDAQGRLDTLRLEQNRLNELISTADAGTLESLKGQLEETYNAIDALEAKMRTWSADIEYAALELTLTEASVAPVATQEPSVMERSQAGFAQSLESVKQFLQDMLVSLAVILPVAAVALPVLAIIVVVVWLLVRRHRRKTASAK